MNTVYLIYKNLCPNCENDITSERLTSALTCEKCLPEIVSPEKICEQLKEIKNFKTLCNVVQHLKKFEKEFKDTTSFKISAIQKMWATRFFLNNSFALIAPTGIGKTTFGLVLTKYIWKNNLGVVYLIFPTNILIKQTKERLIKYGIDENDIVVYDSTLSKKTLERIKKRITEADFKVLVTTTNFLSKNFNIIPKGIYSLIFVDDVNSLVKRSKNIDKILNLLNFSEEDILKTFQAISQRRIFIQKNEIEKLQELEKILNEIKNKRKGVLIVSTATANPKSNRILLFKEFLGFEVGKFISTLRNVVDAYKIVENDIFQEAVNQIKKLGKGGLIFLNSDYTKEDLEKFIEFLKKHKIKTASYEKLAKYIKNLKREK